MKNLYTLLQRQLKRQFGPLDQVPEVIRPLLEVINDAYHQADADRGMSERSLDLSSQELLAANAEMRQAVLALRDANQQMGSRVHERTRELANVNEQLRQAQKMEAIGRLAGGIAHDFNNLLMVMFGYLDILLDGELDPDTRESIVEVRRAADSAAALTRQLLAFSRQQILSPKVLNLSDLISDTAPLLRRLIDTDIELVIDLPIKIGSVRADPVQFQQVLLNLIVNARDAMPNGGTLTISTESLVIDSERAARAGTMRAGRYAVVTVADTGIGMDATVRARIFEPFFTTKEVGRGTGLGLATVYGIVQQSDGFIDVASEPNQGTTFRIFLPEAAGLPEAQRDSGVFPGPGAGVILLVEDEDRLRTIVQRWLQRRGYTVFEARSAAEAQERSASLDRIDLLLTDVVMPQVNGYTLASRLLQSRPGLKVLFMTGHVDDAQVIRDIRATELPLVQKPLSAVALLEAVRDVLAPSSSPRGV